MYKARQLSNAFPNTHCVVDPCGKVCTNSLMHENDAKVLAMLYNHTQFMDDKIRELNTLMLERLIDEKSI